MSRRSRSIFVLIAFSIFLFSCGGSGGGSTSSTTGTTPPPPPPPPSMVSISGQITYDFVPAVSSDTGRIIVPAFLDFDSIEQRPVRAATLQILDANDAVLETTQTNDAGEYDVQIQANQQIRVRVLAELLEIGQAGVAPSWEFRTTDNTNGDALYVLQNSLFSSGTADQIRDLNAPSGWDGTAYTGERAAAPFAILDTVYETVLAFLAVDPIIQFPEAEFRWSVMNTTVSGDRDVGEIGSSSYVTEFINGALDGNVFIVGDVTTDTDEFDRHVIVHEWGHYFEDQLSRSDSIGGPHGLGDFLDFRVAFSEGWGNAISGIVLSDPLYKDTGNPVANPSGNEFGFGFSIEQNLGQLIDSNTGELVALPGWYSESSVQSIIYDIFDAADDGDDVISVGLDPIYQAFINPAYTEQDRSYTSIFSFLAQLIDEIPAESANVSSLAASFDINDLSFEATSETNDASPLSDTSAASVLPIYQDVILNGAVVEVCSDNELDGEPNRLLNRAYLQLDAPIGGFTITAARSRGNLEADPEILLNGSPNSGSDDIFRFDCLNNSEQSSTTTIETRECFIAPGNYLIEIFDRGNTDRASDSADLTGGFACFNVSVTN